MSKLNSEDFLGRKVRIRYCRKSCYERLGIKGKFGRVTRVSSSDLGVSIDGIVNESSSYGVFWLRKYEVELIEEESKLLDNYTHVAVVHLLEDSSKKDYYFALYKEDHCKFLSMCRNSTLIVVNPRNEDNRVLGYIHRIFERKDCDYKVTAEVVGIVDSENYHARQAEIRKNERIQDLLQKLDLAISKEQNKLPDIKYYEEMALKYPDNLEIRNLVESLKCWL